MQKNPENPEELKLDTEDDRDAAYTAASFFIDNEEQREKLLDNIDDAEPGYCLIANDTELILDAFYSLLEGVEREASAMTRACARGALLAFDIQPPAEVIPILVLKNNVQQIF